MRKDLKEFIDNFSIVDNALKMRTLHRWNGRDLHNKENLSEHTHLVVACALSLLKHFRKLSDEFITDVNVEKLVTACLVHDSVEMLRGDILSITKDSIYGIRQEIENEEYTFQSCVVGKLSTCEDDIVRLADLQACYLFIENELKYPSSDFVKSVYISCKKKYDEEYDRVCTNHGIPIPDKDEDVKVGNVFVKGYKEDAGTDILLSEDVIFMPMSTTAVNLKVQVTPPEGQMSLLCARTSAANKGLVVAMCPIDANYNGEVTAIVNNVSNDIVTYYKGTAFCQVITLPIKENPVPSVIKKQGKRSSGKLGSTGLGL